MKAATYDPATNLAAAVGQRVRALRKSRGWTQAALADRAGLPSDTVQSIEARHRKSIGIDELVLLSNALELRAVELAPEVWFGNDKPLGRWKHEAVAT